jgi:excisionase family DNA binding protein
MSKPENHPKSRFGVNSEPEQARQRLEALLAELGALFGRHQRAGEAFEQSCTRLQQPAFNGDLGECRLTAADQRAVLLEAGALAPAIRLCLRRGDFEFPSRERALVETFDHDLAPLLEADLFSFLRGARGLLLKALAAAGESPDIRESPRVPSPGTGKLLALDHAPAGNGQPQIPAEAAALTAPRSGKSPQTNLPEGIRGQTRDIAGKADCAPVPLRLLSAAEAAVYLGRTKEAVEHMVAAGKIPRVRADRRVFLDVRDLDKWIEENKTK